jgi:RNA polymerase sigma-70 factor (ECF subfamily)
VLPKKKTIDGAPSVTLHPVLVRKRRPRSGESDAALVGALLEGRQSAGRIFVDRHAGALQRAVAGVIGPDPDLPDLMQDVLLAVVRSLPRLHDPGSLRAWAHRIAVHKARSMLKSRARRRVVRFIPFDAVPEQAVLPVPAEDRQALRCTCEILEEISDEHRLVFSLRFIDGMELEEIARATDLSVSTVRRRLRRAEAAFALRARKNPTLVERMPKETSREDLQPNPRFERNARHASFACRAAVSASRPGRPSR